MCGINETVIRVGVWVLMVFALIIAVSGVFKFLAWLIK